MKYFFTIIDRFTRLSESIPLPDTTTKTCARALICHWISRFGVPDDITSNCGPQFTSHLWTELNHLLGISASKTSAYHQQANGIVERFYHQGKSSLKYYGMDVNARQYSVSIDRLNEAFGNQADCQSPPASSLGSSSSHTLRAAPSQITTVAPPLQYILARADISKGLYATSRP